MTRTIEFVVPSYAGAWRCARLFESIDRFDPEVRKYPWTVFEDPSSEHESKRYRDQLPIWVHYEKLPRWMNMHGAARYALSQALAKWVVYLGDDVLVTPGALRNLTYFLEENELKTVSLVQPSYWNAHDLSEEGYDGEGSRERGGAVLLKTKEDMYTFDPGWLNVVPRNPHWDGDGYARPYINVNGVGFAVRRSTYDAVGGFAEKTWCLDESISHKVWDSKCHGGVVCLPGPPLIHFFAGAQLSNPPEHDAYLEEKWIEEFGGTKVVTGKHDRIIMDQMTEEIMAEMRSAKYWGSR